MGYYIDAEEINIDELLTDLAAELLIKSRKYC